MAVSRADSFPAPVAKQAGVLAEMIQKLTQALAQPEQPVDWAKAMAQSRAALEQCGQELREGPFVSEDWVIVSRSFCRAGEELAAVVMDMTNLKISPDRFILRLAGLLAEMTDGLAAVSREKTAPAQVRLAEAKARSLEVQAVFRRARAAALEAPAAVESMKAREIYRRLSEVGMAADKAIETLAWISADDGRASRAH